MKKTIALLGIWTLLPSFLLAQTLVVAAPSVKIVAANAEKTNFSKVVGTMPNGFKLAKYVDDVNKFYNVLIPAATQAETYAYVSSASNDVNISTENMKVVCYSDSLLVKVRPDSSSATVTAANGQPVRLFYQSFYATTGEYFRKGNSFWYQVYLLNEYSQNMGWVTNDGINKNNYIIYESDACNSPFIMYKNFEDIADKNIEGKLGKELTLSVGDVRGSGAFTYVWYKDDEEIFIGTKNGTLIIDELEAADLGVYLCVIRNECGSYVSKNFNVKIK
ncbi:MAG: Immunoglobulin domain [Bacteroidota bacterium]|jgi:hypothetical protein